MSTLDGLVNVATGLGTARSKRSSNMWQYGALNDWSQLDAAYQTNWIARQTVDIPAQDMTREWRRIKSIHSEDIERVETALNIKNNVKLALKWSRLFGGAGILMLTNQDLTQPLDVNKIKPGDLERVIVFDRHEMNGTIMNSWNVLSPNYLRPEFYTIQGGHVNIHWSHFARFFGEELPRRQTAQTQGWGDSVLRKCIEDVTDVVAAKGGIAELLTEANIDIITREGLADDLTTDQDAAIIKRYELFSQMKSIINMGLLDGDEKFDRKTLQMSGVSQTLEVLMTWVSGAAKIPVTKLFGTSAKGLNATGEGDLKTYYDDIRAMQTGDMVEPMRTLDEVLVRSALGNMPDDFDYEWNPLAQSNPVEQAQAAALQAQRDQAYLEAGVVERSQVMRNLQSNEVYQYEEGSIEQVEASEDPTMFDTPPEGDPDDESGGGIPEI